MSLCRSLIAGQVDVIAMDRGHLLKKAEKDPSLVARRHEKNGAEVIRINTRNPPLNDIRVRQALALANDQQMHIKLIYADSIPFIHHPFGQWFKCMDHGYPEHNLEKARRLISEYGKKVELEYVHTNTLRGRNTGEMLQQLYKKIGVTLNPVGLSLGPHVMKVVTGDYQLSSSRIYSSDDLGPQLYNRLHSSSPKNHSGYFDPYMDELLDARRTETDPEKRSEIMCKIAKKINSDVPFFYRGGRGSHFIFHKKVRGMMDPSAGRIDLAAAWLDAEIKFNIAAFEIEKNASSAFHCPDPGDTKQVKKVILGPWVGKDNTGAKLKFTFKEDNTVACRRKDSEEEVRKYVICKQDVHWEAPGGAIVVTAGEDKTRLNGKWKFGQYSDDSYLLYGRIKPSTLENGLVPAAFWARTAQQTPTPL